MKLYGQHLPAIKDHKREASVKLLNGVWQLDSRSLPDITCGKYVYFFPQECRFIITTRQLPHYLIIKVDPFVEVNKDKVIEIVARKYPFSQILVRLFVTRGLISVNTFIEIILKRPDWFDH